MADAVEGFGQGLEASERRVVRTEAEYYALWAAHAADSTRVALPPPVDFEREMVLVVALGERPTGGYVVDVVDVELRGRTLRVLTGEREPRPGTFQVQQPTQPYVMVALPAMVARVEFRKVREELGGERRRARPGMEGGGARTADDGVPAEPPKVRGRVQAREPAAVLGTPRGGTR